MSEPNPQPRRRGCLFYGGIIAVVLMVMLLIGVLLGLRLARKMVNEFTDSAPTTLPETHLSADDLARVKGRVDDFRNALRTGKPAQPLTLAADDLNALIASESDFRSLKNKMYLSIQGDQLQGQVSVPMDQLGLPLFKGRYLNGHGTFAVSLQNGVLQVVPQAITVKGKPLPDAYMQKLRGENLAVNFNRTPQATNMLGRLESIQIKDGKLIIVPKPSP